MADAVLPPTTQGTVVLSSGETPYVPILARLALGGKLSSKGDLRALLRCFNPHHHPEAASFLISSGLVDAVLHKLIANPRALAKLVAEKSLLPAEAPDPKLPFVLVKSHSNKSEHTHSYLGVALLQPEKVKKSLWVVEALRAQLLASGRVKSAVRRTHPFTAKYTTVTIGSKDVEAIVWELDGPVHPGRGPLASLLASSPQISAQQAKIIAVHVARELFHIHEVRCFHGSVSPANIWVLENPTRAFLLDFEFVRTRLARHEAEGAGEVEVNPDFFRYEAPEVLAGQNSLSSPDFGPEFRGQLLWELFSNQHFLKDNSASTAILYEFLNTPEALSLPSVGEELVDAAIRLCLVKSPDSRVSLSTLLHLVEAIGVSLVGSMSPSEIPADFGLVSPESGIRLRSISPDLAQLAWLQMDLLQLERSTAIPTDALDGLKKYISGTDEPFHDRAKNPFIPVPGGNPFSSIFPSKKEKEYKKALKASRAMDVELSADFKARPHSVFCAGLTFASGAEKFARYLEYIQTKASGAPSMNADWVWNKRRYELLRCAAAVLSNERRFIKSTKAQELARWVELFCRDVDFYSDDETTQAHFSILQALCECDILMAKLITPGAHKRRNLCPIVAKYLKQYTEDKSAKNFALLMDVCHCGQARNMPARDLPGPSQRNPCFTYTFEPRLTERKIRLGVRDLPTVLFFVNVAKWGFTDDEDNELRKGSLRSAFEDCRYSRNQFVIVALTGMEKLRHQIETFDFATHFTDFTGDQRSFTAVMSYFKSTLQATNTESIIELPDIPHEEGYSDWLDIIDKCWTSHFRV